MIRAPFIRLALLSLCSLYVLGLLALAAFIAWWWALVVVVPAVVLAFVLDMDYADEKPRRQRTTRMK